MQQSHRCPKCHHDRILFIRDVLDQGGGAAHLAHVPTGGSFLGMQSVERTGKQVAYVCRRCGYTEHYTLGAAEIPIDGQSVVELVAPAQEPYR